MCVSILISNSSLLGSGVCPPFCPHPSYNKKATLFELLLFVNLLVQNSNLLLEDLKRLNQLKDTQIQAGLDTKKDTLIKKTGVQRKI